MQFFLTNKTLDRHCLILQPDLHTVYKLTIRSTGQYYIGVTQDLKKRVDNHGWLISSAMTDSNVSEAKKYLPFHLEAAKALQFDHDFDGLAIERVIRAGIMTQVYGVVVGRKYALALETMYILDALADPLCLNENISVKTQ
jgi:predicted GIY-YIG superfamily endonuclease